MRLRVVAAAAAILLLSSGLVGLVAAVPQVPFTMRAFAVNMTNVNVPRGNAGVMQIRITGWSPAWPAATNGRTSRGPASSGR